MWRIKIKLKDILKEQDIDQKTLAKMTEEAGTPMTESAISLFARDARSALNKEYMCILGKVLELESISDLIEFEKD
ncbi:MAG: hypothetical protein RO469_04175 [Thermincola sp.]|jgi:DNA-binding Xre family transcriptional regulator|nr:hypothetical protein [Thermincola sp.]MDT3704252.1 hypothetical protein [Thermincola sp.]